MEEETSGNVNYLDVWWHTIPLEMVLIMQISPFVLRHKAYSFLPLPFLKVFFFLLNGVVLLGTKVIPTLLHDAGNTSDLESFILIWLGRIFRNWYCLLRNRVILFCSSPCPPLCLKCSKKLSDFFICYFPNHFSKSTASNCKIGARDNMRMNGDLSLPSLWMWSRDSFLYFHYFTKGYLTVRIFSSCG